MTIQATRRRATAGFTLIELLVAITTSTIAVGLIPAIQKVRDAETRSAATNNIRQMGLALHSVHDTTKQFPATMADALRAAGWPENGERDGMKASSYERTSNGWSIVLNPLPGVTGSETAYARGNASGQVSIEWRPTPGAAEGRKAMLENVRASTAIAIAEMMMQVPGGSNLAELLRREMADPAMLERNAERLRGANGQVSLGSMQFVLSDGSVRSFQATVWERIQSAMQLGAYGEKWLALPGVSPGLVKSGPGTLMLPTYNGIRELTFSFVFDAGARRTLAGYLDRAEAAAKRGDRVSADAAMKAYADTVRAIAGEKLPLISPIGEATTVTFVGGWGASSYQYALGDIY